MSQQIEVTAPDQTGLGTAFTIAKVHAHTGSMVSVGDIIATLENEVATFEMEAFDHGEITWLEAVGTTVTAGQLIANVATSEELSSCTVRLELNKSETLALDALRGTLSRQHYLKSLLNKPNNG